MTLLVEPLQSFQATLARPIHCTGIGVHGGQPVRLRLVPAAPDHGIVFQRTDLPGGPRIPARWDAVTDTRLCTILAGADGATVGTVEHLMAALAAAGIDNLLVELDGPEVPILDGSAEPFLFLIGCAGRVEQTRPRRALKVLKPVTVELGPARATLSPAPDLELAAEIEFACPAIGRQSVRHSLSTSGFRREIARARTFGFVADLDRMRAAGLGLGADLSNAVAIDGDRVVNPEGLRFPDEFVRHKLLDMVGDLALAGRPLLGRVEAYRPGHALNNALLRALFADPTAWVEILPAQSRPAGAQALHETHRRLARAA